MNAEWGHEGEIPFATRPAHTTAAQSLTPVNRVLLVTLGEAARAAGQAAQKLSRRWLACEPPLVCIHLSSAERGEEDAKAFMAATDKLAGQTLAASLADAGFTFRQRDELTLWVVVSLAAADASQTGEPPADRLTVAAGQIVPDAMLAAVEQAEQVASQRARLHVDANLFILADPVEQGAAAKWIRAWQGAERGHAVIAGPVNHEHLRLEPQTWQARVVESLVTLLWGSFPGHAMQQDRTEVRVMGASAWTPPLPEMKRWLVLRSAKDAALLLRTPGWSSPDSRTEGTAASALPIVQAEAWAAELRRAAPPAAPPVVIQAAWPALRTFPDALDVVIQRQSDSDREAHRRARIQWLERCLLSCDAALSSEVAAHLAPAAALPQVAACMARLKRILAAAEAEQGVVDDGLARAAARLKKAQRRAAQANTALRATCGRFPPDTWPGWASALMRPWQWPGWAWAWFSLLPHQLRDVESASAECSSAEREEATWHAVRQALLAVRQSVQRVLADVSRIDQRLMLLTEAYDAELDSLAGAVDPWAAPLLERLWAGSSRLQVEDQLRSALAQTTPAGRAAAPAESAAETWAQEFSASENAIERWGALECLVCGLAGSIDPTPETSAPALRSWLDHQLDRAVPLWPQPTTEVRADTDMWLLLPRSEMSSILEETAFAAPAAVTAPRGGRRSEQYAAMLNEWCVRRLRSVQRAAGGGESLAVVRWYLIPLADLEDDAALAGTNQGSRLLSPPRHAQAGRT